eukprot:PRCOL_00004265-RA
MGAVEDAVDDAMSARGPGGPLSYAGGPHQLAAVRKALVDARREFVSLVALAAPATLRSGKTGKLLKLEGTVPMYHRGNKYNLPVAVWLPEAFPAEPPACFLVPAPTMLIKPRHSCVDSMGHCVTPYILNWMANASNIVDMLHSMNIAFGSDPPLYTMPQGRAPRDRPPQDAHAQLTHVYARRSAGYVETAANGHASSSEAVPSATASASADRSAGPMAAFRTSAIAELTAKLRAALQADSTAFAVEYDRTLAKQRSLQERGQAIRSMATALAEERTGLETAVGALHAHAREVNGWLEQHGKAAAEASRSISVDELVVGASPRDDQVARAAADDAAVEDTLYALDDMLARGRLPFDNYMKRVRSLCREQFTARETARRVMAAERYGES